ncbi:condensation domain-containing protein [Micromonospora sp. NPDC047762]|uniref:condensation domain-containing protein n=1 Tax=Micromonospora sp. NPDC047762 TaxID=3364255 RepID=UPI00371B0DC4
MVYAENRFPFSIEQEFLRGQHQEDGSTAGFGPRPISSGGWRLTGLVDADLLRGALDDVIARHEPLRTMVIRGADGWEQEVRDPCPARLQVHDLGDDPDGRGVRAERFLDEAESGHFDADELPLLWAYLGRFDDRDAVLVLVAYLPLIDVWSLGIVMDDLAACYAARLAGGKPDLPDPPRYRDYVRRTEGDAAAGGSDPSFEYWRERLAGARPVVIAADRPANPDHPGVTRVDRFQIDARLGSAALRLGRATGSSPFMVIFAAQLIHLQRMTGVSDGVVWTLTPGPGRRHEWAEATVGYFVNMSPLRTDISGCVTYRDVLARVRATCLEAFPHEVPFVGLAQRAPDVIAGLEQGGMVVPGFAVFQNPSASKTRSAGAVEYAPVRRRLSQAQGPGIPDDAILWTIDIDPDGEIFCAVSSSTDRFEQATVDRMLAEFRDLFGRVLADPDAPLAGARTHEGAHS